MGIILIVIGVAILWHCIYNAGLTRGTGSLYYEKYGTILWTAGIGFLLGGISL